MATTKLTNLINPEVMGQMISAKLPEAIKFAAIANVDTTLVGRPGNTVSLPSYAYIGDAADVAEGVDMVPALLSATSAEVTVKKAGKAVELTDESVLSGYGDPVNEAEKQLRMAIASKIDNDVVAALDGIAAGMTVGDGTAAISAASISDAMAKFGENMDQPAVLFIAASQLAKLRKDNEFIAASALGDSILMTGVIGSIYGAQVVVSDRVKANGGKFNNFIVQPGAVGIFLKRDVEVEADRNVLGKKTVLAADEHYAVYLQDASKAVKLVTKA